MPFNGACRRGQCTFTARLSDEEVRQLSDYVLEQAANGWK